MEHNTPTDGGKLPAKSKTKRSMRRTLLNDIIFKIVFGTPKNERILRALLNAVLDLSGPEKIVQIAPLSGELSKDHIFAKGAILDVRARDQAGRRYNIELQVREQPRYVDRSLYYLSRLYSQQLKRGDEYEKLKRTVAISILDFPLFPDTTALHTRFRFCDPVHGLELSDILEIHYLELAKFRRTQPLVTPLEKWLHALKFADIYALGLVDLPEPIQAEEEIVMALDIMNDAYSDEEVRDYIDCLEKAERDEIWRRNNAVRRAEAEALAKGQAEGLARGQAEGLAEGLAQGRAEGEALAREKMSRALAEQGIDAETIYKATGIRISGVPEGGGDV